MSQSFKRTVIMPKLTIPLNTWIFAAGGGHRLLWLNATTFLSHRGAYSQQGVAIVACGQRPHRGLISHKSRLLPGLMVTRIMPNKLFR